MASVNGPPSWLLKGYMTIFLDMASTCGKFQRTDERRMMGNEPATRTDPDEGRRVRALRIARGS
ncbi:hypothetical protein EMCG_00443 [[Emmonsia] crescens]|uniref:Uncharacterized protein n=1 Tax=[Emmonsia] crescens TaxID=73230 RepID=A0A0G2J8I2_9EURO|nr:hypothetical protein EMCG_00443 [Emmonsia crescens UAMH 3008]